MGIHAGAFFIMTPRQTALYFREWANVRATCQRNGYPTPDRHALHAQALGHDKSSKHFTNTDLDRVLAEFLAITRPDSLSHQLRQHDQPRIRLIYSIQQLAPETYWSAIANDKFGTADLNQLDLQQLQHLRITLAARLSPRNS